MSSEAGTQQGCPLGALLFCLVLDVLVGKIAVACPGLDLNNWYMDNGSIIGDKADVLRAYEIISTYGPPLGLHLNPTKCELVWCTGRAPLDDPFPHNIARYRGTNLDMLGAAIGDEMHCCDWVGKKVTKKAVPVLDNLSLLEDPQTEFILLNYCINFCRMVFFIRTTPSHLIQAATLQYDTLVLRALERMVGRSIGDPAVSRAVLSIKNGGLGIRSSTAHSTAAYISSFNTCWQLVGAMMSGPPSVETLTPVS